MARKALATITTDESGAIAPIFALVFSAVLLCAGLGIDAARVVHTQRALASASDAAALAAGRALIDGRVKTEAEAKALAIKYFRANVTNAEKFADVPDPVVNVNFTTGEVQVLATGAVDASVGRISNVDNFQVKARSSVVSDQKDIELGVALDLTGSMSGQKIKDLKDAANDLVDILIPEGKGSAKVRIGFAPYSASVNAGEYASITTNGASNGCVHERGGANAFNDVMPVGNQHVFGVDGACPSAKVIAMTSDKGKLKSNIATYSARGLTAGHIGAAWASYLISPKWDSIWPNESRAVRYKDAKTIKAMVLMTDGEFNTRYVAANGNSDQQARKICEEAKERGVTVYAIGFKSPEVAEQMLQYCASSGAHYFNAQNGTELRQAFIQIAKHLNNLRIAE